MSCWLILFFLFVGFVLRTDSIFAADVVPSFCWLSLPWSHLTVIFSTGKTTGLPLMLVVSPGQSEVRDCKQLHSHTHDHCSNAKSLAFPGTKMHFEDTTQFRRQLCSWVGKWHDTWTNSPWSVLSAYRDRLEVSHVNQVNLCIEESLQYQYIGSTTTINPVITLKKKMVSWFGSVWWG